MTGIRRTHMKLGLFLGLVLAAVSQAATLKMVDVNNNSERPLRECLTRLVLAELDKTGVQLAELSTSYAFADYKDPMTLYFQVKLRLKPGGAVEKYRVALRSSPADRWRGYSFSVSGGVGGISVGSSFAGYTTASMDASAYFQKDDAAHTEVFRFDVSPCWYQP